MSSLTRKQLNIISRFAIVCALFLLSFGAAGLLRPGVSAQDSEETVPPAPAQVFIAIDNSTTQSAAEFALIQQAANEVVGALPEDAQVGVISFGNFPQVTELITPDKARIRNAIASMVQEDGDSQLFSAIKLGAESYDPNPNAPKSIILFTDGQDGSSAQSIELSKRAAVTNSVQIKVVDSANGIGTDPQKNSVLVQVAGSRDAILMARDTKALKQLAQQIGSPAELALTGSAPSAGIIARITSSTLVLLIGALLVGGGIFVGAMQLLGPKEVKVNLTGIPFTPPKMKDLKTPMAGLATKLTDLADKKLEDSGKSSGMQAWLERAAINLRSGEFLVLAAVASLILGAAFALKFGKLWAPLGLLVGAFGSRFYVNRKANKRSKLFGDQLSDTLQLLSSSMRAGQGFMQALDAVARESDAPTSDEFRRVVVETRLGRDLLDAMKALAVRIRCVDLEWVIPAVEINRDVGGDLAEVLEQVGATIRDRADLRRQVKTLSAEGRLSAVVLIGMPIVLGFFIKMSNPDYMAVLFEGIGLYLLGGAGFLMLIGSIWLFNLCKIEF